MWVWVWGGGVSSTKFPRRGAAEKSFITAELPEIRDSTLGGGIRRRWEDAGAWPGPARLAQPPVSKQALGGRDCAGPAARPGSGTGTGGLRPRTTHPCLPGAPAAAAPVYLPLFSTPWFLQVTHTPFRAPHTLILHCPPRPGLPPPQKSPRPPKFLPTRPPRATPSLHGRATQHAGNSPDTLRHGRK